MTTEDHQPEHSLILPDNTGIPEDDDAERDDAGVDHTVDHTTEDDE